MPGANNMFPGQGISSRQETVENFAVREADGLIAPFTWTRDISPGADGWTVSITRPAKQHKALGACSLKEGEIGP